MEQMFRIESEENETSGAFFVMSMDRRIAEMQWRSAGENVIDIHHTFTDPSLRGKGVARELVERAVELAQERNWKIRPSCSYARKVLTTTPQYKDLVVG